MSTEEAVRIVECRTVLDGLLARRAAERVGDDEIVRLRAHLSLMRKTVGAGDLLRYSMQVAELHRAVRAAAHHPTAAELVDRLQAHRVRHQFQLSLRPERARRSLAELSDIVDAVADHDPGRAETAVRRHFDAVIRTLRDAS